MGEAKRRKDQGLPPKNKQSKGKVSGFAQLKNSAHSQSKKKITNAEIKEKEALVFIQEGKLNEAEEIYKQLIARGSQNHIVYGNLAGILQIKGHKEGQINLLKKALKLKPDYPEAHIKLGISLKKQGKIDDAIISFKEGIKLNSKNPKAYYNLGNAFKEKGDLNSAIISFQKAIKLKPNFPEAHGNLAITLTKSGDLNAAIVSFKRAITLKPDSPKTYLNLGNAQQEKGNLNAAIESFKYAIRLQPSFAEAYLNLGIALKEYGKLNDAILSFKSAIKLQPNFIEAFINLSLTYLLSNDYQLGWKFYDWRLETKDKKENFSKLQIPKWQGENLENGDKLLIISEQGLGDVMHFMRYIPYLKEKGIDISFCAPTKLHNLIKTSNIHTNPLKPESAKTFSKGKWIPLLSLPQKIGVNPVNPIITDPYIYTTDELTSKWKDILSKEKRPIIGVNWQGNPNIEKNNYPGRSFPLEYFSKLLDENQITFVSLQKGYGSDQLNNCSFRNKFVKCQQQINSTWEFIENAAIIINCDLIITCDTSVAHLAGGMGKTVWLLLRDIPFWTWGMQGEQTFWYPSMRLFRQSERQNWNDVMRRVSKELQILIKKKFEHSADK